MSARPGFNISNINVEKRAEAHQESVIRCVLSKNLGVLFIPNPDKLPTKELVKKFLNEIVIYKNEKDCNPLGWAKPAGSFQGTSNFRAEMSSSFWNFFVETGRKNLMVYNKSNHCAIKVVRDQTLKLSDAENLSLYLRKKIVKYCEKNKTNITEFLVERYDNFKDKSTTLAILLGWDYTDWKGAAIKEMLSDEEKSDFNSIFLDTLFNNDGLEVVEHTDKNKGDPKKDDGSISEEQRNKRKRDDEDSETNMQKMPRCEEVPTTSEE